MNDTLQIIKAAIEALLAQNGTAIGAIAGKCTSGKTTLAARLAEIYDCNVLHMDDFFLRPEQRTQERFAEIGGNVDYERFKAEVLLPLRSGKAFSYRPFLCGSQTLGEPIAVSSRNLPIVEGTYSLHPYFEDPYDLKILLTVTEETQRQRVLNRPQFLHDRFFKEWIPMENRYFEVLPLSTDVLIL